MLETAYSSMPKVIPLIEARSQKPVFRGQKPEFSNLPNF